MVNSVRSSLRTVPPLAPATRASSSWFVPSPRSSSPRERTTPTLETYAPVELLFAPALTGLRTRAGANGSHALGTVVRARVLAEALTMGRRTDVARSPLVFHGALALEFAIGRRIAVELSGHVYESDQHRTRLVDAGDGTVRRERVRSVDVFPSLDVIVRGP